MKDDLKVPNISCRHGAGVYPITRNLASPQVPKDLTYDNLKTLLEGHFKPTPLTITERFKFHHHEQKPQESVSDYVVAIKELAGTCEFGEFLQQPVFRGRLVCGLHSEAIQKRLLAEKDFDMDILSGDNTGYGDGCTRGLEVCCCVQWSW